MPFQQIEKKKREREFFFLSAIVASNDEAVPGWIHRHYTQIRSLPSKPN